MVEPKLTAKQWDLRFEEDLVKGWASEPDRHAFDPDRRPRHGLDTPPPRRRGAPACGPHPPPPYPSGTWHPGAVIGYSMIDMIARSQRMLGKAVLFPMGLDRNGINIERTVEKKYGKPLHEWD